MNKMKIEELTNEELLKEAKKMKQTKFYDALIIGILVGIATYSSVKNGFGFLTFLPLIYIPIIKKKNTKNRELEELLKERNLK